MSDTATPAPVATKPAASFSAAVNALMAWLSSQPFLHVAGIAAIAVLMAVGTITATVGLPILTGLVGLGINTSSST